MRRLLLAALCLLLAVSPAFAGRRSYSSGHTRSYSTRSYSPRTYRAPRNTYRATTPRTRTYPSPRARTHTTRPGSRRYSQGTEVRRDPAQRDAFQRSHPCPSTGKRSGACPGYVVDHIQPLAKGGADHPSNMQWQTVQAAREKDKWERK